MTTLILACAVLVWSCCIALVGHSGFICYAPQTTAQKILLFGITVVSPLVALVLVSCALGACIGKWCDKQTQ